MQAVLSQSDMPNSTLSAIELFIIVSSSSALAVSLIFIIMTSLDLLFIYLHFATLELSHYDIFCF